MAKVKQNRILSPNRRAVGSGFYDKIIPSQATRTACSKCGGYSTLIGADGECLKCRLQERAAAREASA